MNWIFDIDIVGGCNLRCLTCPVGDSIFNKVSKPNMTLDLFKKIMQKAKNECENPLIQLYNWTEPFLHPKLSEIIKIVKKNNFACIVSSNLNIDRNLENVLLEQPDTLIVSVSGFSQDVYGIIHKRGNIEKVKKNMKKVCEIIQKNKLKTQLILRYHIYTHSIKERHLMKEYCDEIGFNYTQTCTYFSSVEKTLKYLKSDFVDIELFEKDLQISQNILPKLEKIIPICEKMNDKKCTLMDTHITLTSSGKILPCCGIYDESKYVVCDYLTTPLKDIQKLKKQQEICKECTKYGLNKLVDIDYVKLSDNIPYEKYL